MFTFSIIWISVAQMLAPRQHVARDIAFLACNHIWPVLQNFYTATFPRSWKMFGLHFSPEERRRPLLNVCVLWQHNVDFSYACVTISRIEKTMRKCWQEMFLFLENNSKSVSGVNADFTCSKRMQCKTELWHWPHESIWTVYEVIAKEAILIDLKSKIRM